MRKRKFRCVSDDETKQRTVLWGNPFSLFLFGLALYFEFRGQLAVAQAVEPFQSRDPDHNPLAQKVLLKSSRELERVFEEAIEAGKYTCGRAAISKIAIGCLC